MTIQRRSFIAGILGAAMAPAIARSGILMPVKKVWVPEGIELTYSTDLNDLSDRYLRGLTQSMRATKEAVASGIYCAEFNYVTMGWCQGQSGRIEWVRCR